MSHKLLESELPESKKTSKLQINWPRAEGKIGCSLYLWGKELFIGIVLSEVITETVVKKRSVKIPKSNVKVFPFD